MKQKQSSVRPIQLSTEPHRDPTAQVWDYGPNQIGSDYTELNVGTPRGTIHYRAIIVYGEDDERPALARLLCAAPELKNACEIAVRALRNHEDGNEDSLETMAYEACLDALECLDEPPLD